MGKITLADAQRAAALAAVDWERIDAMTEEHIARQIAEDPDAAPDLSDIPADALRVIHPEGGVSVRGIRAKLNLTQRVFARRFGFNLATLRDWEQGRYQPDAATQTLLFVIERDPDLVATVVAQRPAT